MKRYGHGDSLSSTLCQPIFTSSPKLHTNVAVDFTFRKIEGQRLVTFSVLCHEVTAVLGGSGVEYTNPKRKPNYLHPFPLNLTPLTYCPTLPQSPPPFSFRSNQTTDEITWRITGKVRYYFFFKVLSFECHLFSWKFLLTTQLSI